MDSDRSKKDVVSASAQPDSPGAREGDEAPPARYRADGESVEVTHVDHPGEETYGPEDAKVTEITEETPDVQAADPMGMSATPDIADEESSDDAP